MIEIQTVVIVGGLIVNAIAVVWNIIETFRLHKQTNELQESNARLQTEVHRLSVHLNQEIVRLNRINQLTKDLYESSAGLIFKHALATSGDDDESNNSNAATYSDEEIVNFFVTFEGSLVEMKAIATIIGDAELMSLIEKTRESMPNLDPKASKADFYEGIHEFGNHATALHLKTYTLLQEVTSFTREE